MTTPGLEAPSDARLRERSSIKWSRAGPDEIPVDIAELDFAVAPPVRRALRDLVARSDLGYPDFSHGTPVRLGELFAERTYRHWGWSPDPARVTLSGQVMQALCCSVIAFTEPGDIVLTHAPTYPPIVHAVEDLGRCLVAVPVKNLERLSELDEMLSRRPAGRVRMLVLVNPHNPTGHVFDRRTLEVIGAFVDRENVVVFSDEIYQDLVYRPERYRPAAAVATLSSRTVTFTSAAKSFNIPGLRCAVGHFGSAELHASFSRLPWHLRDGASLPGVTATLAAWRDGDAWLGALRDELWRNREAVGAALAQLGSVRWSPPEAGYLGWLDLGGSPAAKDPRGFLLDRAGLALQPGAVFGAAFSTFARLNFGTSRERLDRVLARLAKALGGETRADPGAGAGEDASMGGEPDGSFGARSP